MYSICIGLRRAADVSPIQFTNINKSQEEPSVHLTALAGMSYPEIISVAPMLEVTDRHFNYFLRGISKCTTLYTEMHVDTTLIHQFSNLEYFIGIDRDCADPTVIQLGGSQAEELKQATEIVCAYGGYSEINLNCGCPSPKVYKRCFGARLMLDPELVRQLVSTMARVSNVPITVKCRIGADDVDSYEDLTRFIATVHMGGVDKFIIHSRKCLLNGLTPKQNRDIPPLRYDVVHRLISDFPELKFVINGGINSLEEVDTHLFDSYESYPPAHGVMMGRAIQNDPFLLATVDSRYYGQRNPQLTRRQVMERYLEHCDFMQSDDGPRKDYRGKVSLMGSALMVKAVHHAFKGCDGNGQYRRAMDEAYVEMNGKYEKTRARDIVSIINSFENKLFDCVRYNSD